MCVGLANGCIGYLPTSADVENGGCKFIKCAICLPAALLLSYSNYRTLLLVESRRSYFPLPYSEESYFPLPYSDECMVSHVVYGWTQELGRAAEGLVLDAASTLLHRASRAGAQLTARSLDSGMPESHDTCHISSSSCANCNLSGRFLKKGNEFRDWAH